MKGAAAGMLAGGLLSLGSIVSTMFADNWGADGLKAWYAQHPLIRTLAEQPAIWGLPLALFLMVVVSKATRSSVPADVRRKMLVLHAPETLGLKEEYIKEHEGLGGH
jgi:Na+(H+)/acetate symporter ActP